jgi:hypothetical protein
MIRAVVWPLRPVRAAAASGWGYVAAIIRESYAGRMKKCNTVFIAPIRPY